MGNEAAGEQLGEVKGILDNLSEVSLEDDGNQEIDDIDEEEELDQEIDNDSSDELDGEEFEDESEDDSEVEDDADSDESGEVSNLGELAEHLETDEETLYNLEVPLADGKESVTIGALKDSYMDIERTKDQISKDRQNVQSAQDMLIKQQESLKEFPAMNDELMNAAVQIKSIEQAWGSIDWDGLEREDATQALLQQQKLSQAYEAAKQQYSLIQNKIKKAQSDNSSTIKAKSKEQILNLIPEWKDNETFQKEGDYIGNFLEKDYGFSPQEIQKVYDPRLSKLLRDFMLLKQKVDGVDTTVRKVRKIPKNLSGVSKTGKGKVKKIAFKKKVDKATKSRDVRDKVNVVSDIINSLE